MIAEAFYTFVSAQGGITSLTDSIYPQFLPQAHQGFPAITYGQDANADQQLLSGVSALKEALFSVDCWDYSYLTAHTLANAVESALIGYTGTFGAHTAYHIRKEREIDLYEDDTTLHRVSLQFLVAYV